MARVLVGTSEGLRAFASDGRALQIPTPGWDGASTEVTVLAGSADGPWAVVGRHELWRTDPDGWRHVVTLGNLDLECVAATSSGVLVGTTEAHLVRVDEPPTPLVTLEAFERTPGRDGWYTPWGGPPATRSIAERDGSIFVNVHVGGIPRSRDGGATWEPTIDVDADVHRVWAGPPGVFAACALGLAVSEDDGDTWRIEREGMHARYCRGVTVAGDTVLVSASAGPSGGRAAVYRRPVGGGRLERCERGLPQWFEGNIDSACLDATPELAAFGTEDGRVFVSTDEGASWDELAAGLPRIHAVLVGA